jgi:hypothetical protein
MALYPLFPRGRLCHLGLTSRRRNGHNNILPHETEGERKGMCHGEAPRDSSIRATWGGIKRGNFLLAQTRARALFVATAAVPAAPEPRILVSLQSVIHSPAPLWMMRLAVASSYHAHGAVRADARRLSLSSDLHITYFRDSHRWWLPNL